jgi:hypothetical protein
MIKINRSDRITLGLAGALLLATIIIFSVLLLFSCKISKHTAADTTIKSTETTFDSATYLRNLLEEQKRLTAESEKKAEAAATFMSDNDSILNRVVHRLQDDNELTRFQRDSIADELIKAQKNCGGGSATVKPDGSFELKGLKTLNLKLSDALKTSEFYKRTSEQEYEKRIASEKRESELKERIDILQKSKPAFPVWLFIVFGVGVIIAWEVIRGRIMRFVKWIRN